MSAPANQEVFASDAKENAGIASLFRGFLTMSIGKDPVCREVQINQRLYKKSLFRIS